MFGHCTSMVCSVIWYLVNTMVFLKLVDYISKYHGIPKIG